MFVSKFINIDQTVYKVTKRWNRHVDAWALLTDKRSRLRTL